MTLELLPIGQRCNIACTYCYEQPMRDLTGNRAPAYDLAAMEKLVRQRKEPFTIFGGEPLLLPLADLERLWAVGLELWEARERKDTRGRKIDHANGVQTNATLITDAHVELFRRYRVHVGVSLDGPGELNDARRVGDLDATRLATSRSVAALERLLAEKISCSLIVTLHRLNGTAERLPELLAWIKDLALAGLRSVRIHSLELDGTAAELLALSEDEAVAAHVEIREALLGLLEPDVIRDMRALLRGQDDEVTCVWNGCDPWTTPAVQGVDGQGRLTNCGRTNKDGLDWTKAAMKSQLRQLVLRETPYEDGGCKGCRFWVACKGSCPGHAIDGDWRNRPTDCRVWMRLFAVVERDLLRCGETPVSLRKDLPEIDAAMARAWEAGEQISVKEGMRRARAGGAIVAVPGGSHGDAPHGDSHGDHDDAAGALVALHERLEVRA